MLNADSLRKTGRTLIGLSALLLLNAFPFMPSAQAAPQDTVIVCTQPGGDVEAAKKSLKAAGCSILREIPFVTGNFTIFHVRPFLRNVNAVVAKFNGSVDPNIVSAETTFQSKFQHSDNHGSNNDKDRDNGNNGNNNDKDRGNGNNGNDKDDKDDRKPVRCTPNDPDYPSQYSLANMAWDDARCTLRLVGIEQTRNSRFTLIDSGCATVDQEMQRIQQFNFAGGVNGVEETNFDSGVHGTAVAGIAAAKTNNKKFLSGVASQDGPVNVTCCRISNDGVNIDTMDVINAMVWCVDHHKERNGRGVINMSVNSLVPPTYNASPVMQEIAKHARRNGDLFINGSGNSGIVDPSPELHIRRVLALDEDNNLATFSNTGPFNAGAPGVLVATFGSPTTIAFGTGTSFACPNWAASVAMLMSYNTRLNAHRADQIIYLTADTTQEGYKIPNINRAVITAVLNDCY